MLHTSASPSGTRTGASLDDSPLALVAAVRRIIDNRKLIGRLAARDIQAKYRGSVFGLVWAVFTPLLMLLIFTFVFGVVFKGRWASAAPDAPTQEFALIIFFGLTVYNFAAEALSRAPTAITSNVSYVKKVVFPLEILTIVIILSSLTQFAISFSLFMGFYLFVFGAPPIEILLFPIVFAPLLIAVAGVSWLLASLGVFVRDLAQFIPLVLTALLFLSPIFFPLANLPDATRSWLGFGPLAPILESARAVVIFGEQPDWAALGVYTLAALAVGTFGYWWFYRTQKGFADVL